MTRFRPRLLPALLIIIVLLCSPATSSGTGPLAVHSAPSNDGWDPVWRLTSRLFPSTSRRLSSEAKGELGEANIRPAMRYLAKELGDDLEVEEWFVEKGVLERGVDSLFRNVSRQRFNVVESKATTETRVLYEGVLSSAKAGQEMSPRWIRRSLADLRDRAARLLADSGSSAERKQAAKHLLETLDEIEKLSFKRVDKTLVVTRLRGVDPDLLDPKRGIYRSIHPNLLRNFDYVFEMDRSGRVLAVIPGTR